MESLEVALKETKISSQENTANVISLATVINNIRLKSLKELFILKKEQNFVKISQMWLVTVTNNPPTNLGLTYQYFRKKKTLVVTGVNMNLFSDLLPLDNNYVIVVQLATVRDFPLKNLVSI